MAPSRSASTWATRTTTTSRGKVPDCDTLARDTAGHSVPEYHNVRSGTPLAVAQCSFLYTLSFRGLPGCRVPGYPGTVTPIVN
eukprot:2539045-Rhodomonas_salina.3